MKLLCPACERLTDFNEFRLADTALWVRCPRCGVEEQVPLPEVEVRERTPLPLLRAVRDDELAVPASLAPFLPPARNRGSGDGSRATAAQSSVAPAVAPRDVDAAFAGLLERLSELKPVPSVRARAVPPRVGELEIARGRLVEEAHLPPPGFCPKCVAPRPADALLCAGCGLVFANFRPEEHRPSDALEAAWRSLAAQWNRPEEHDHFLQFAFQTDELPKAGRLYRIRLAEHPEDGAARSALDAMVRMASSAAVLVPSPDVHGMVKRRRQLAMLVVLLIALPVLFVLFHRLFGSR